MLALQTGPEGNLVIECFLNPRMHVFVESDDTSQAYSTRITKQASSSTPNDAPTEKELPMYSCARVQLPPLNSDLTCDTLLMWEAVEVSTGLIGIPSLLNLHSSRKPAVSTSGGDTAFGTPVEGLSYHFFAVGGQPLDLIGLVTNKDTDYSKVTAKGAVVPTYKSSTIDMNNLKNIRTTLMTDGKYPIETWSPDPTKNENTKFYGQFTGGIQTPPVLQLTNSTKTVLLDRYGVGPLCKADGLYLTSADVTGLFYTQDNAGNNYTVYRGLPRYFQVSLRKRPVKNPYPVQSLLSNLFNCTLGKMTGQPMEGTENQVEEVKVYDGTEPLPGDPTISKLAVPSCVCTETVVPICN